MAVKSVSQDNKLILEIDNGDLAKLNEVMEKWSFKDYQSLLRFSVSILLLNEAKSFGLKIDGTQQEIIPAKELLK